mgnify:CR=1 FL=1
MTTYWEPWTPKVGDWVQVRLSPECEFRCPNGCDWHEFTSTGDIGQVDFISSGEYPICAIENGQCGTRWYNSSWMESHPYCIGEVGWFAAAELTPIQEPQS